MIKYESFQFQSKIGNGEILWNNSDQLFKWKNKVISSINGDEDLKDLKTEEKQDDNKDLICINFKKTEKKKAVIVGNSKKKFRRICPTCGASVLSLKDHIARVHNRVGFRKCDYCDYEFPPGDMKRHVASAHTESVTHHCPWCGRFTKDLPRHLKRQQCNVPEDERIQVEKETCTICGKILANKHSLNKHMQQHDPTKVKHCDQCEYKTTNNFNLVAHIKRVHEGRPLKEQCPHCNKTVISIEWHIKTYHGGIVQAGI